MPCSNDIDHLKTNKLEWTHPFLHFICISLALSLFKCDIYLHLSVNCLGNMRSILLTKYQTKLAKKK